MIELKTNEDVLDQILFEMVVLSVDVPTNDMEMSLSTIVGLSNLPQDVGQLLILNGMGMIGSAEGYLTWRQIYADALMDNGQEELAYALQDRALKNAEND